MPTARAFVQVEELSLPEKRYFRIGAVSQLIGEEPHVIRYWQSMFSRWVQPHKSRSKHRLFYPADVRHLWAIKQMLHTCGLTLEGARGVLHDGRWAFVEPGSLKGDGILTTAEEAALDAQAAAERHEATA